MTDIEFAFDGGVLTATLNRPDSLNSLTSGMLDELADALDAAATDSRVKVVRLGGAGRALSSGAGIGKDNRLANTADQVLNAANRAVRSIVRLPKPVVAVAHGPVAGVGVSLALACDLVIASDKADFLLAFTRIGLMPDGGASALVAAAVGRIRAMRMALLAERISAAEAFEFGLVTGVYPPEELEAAVTKLIGRLTAGPAVALAKTKEAVNAATLTELDAAIERESAGQRKLLLAHDFAEGIAAFQQRRRAEFRDANPA
jgi:enoyl-CoA hydratase